MTKNILSKITTDKSRSLNIDYLDNRFELKNFEAEKLKHYALSCGIYTSRIKNLLTQFDSELKSINYSTGDKDKDLLVSELMCHYIISGLNYVSRSYSETIDILKIATIQALALSDTCSEFKSESIKTICELYTKNAKPNDFKSMLNRYLKSATLSNITNVFPVISEQKSRLAVQIIDSYNLPNNKRSIVLDSLSSSFKELIEFLDEHALQVEWSTASNFYKYALSEMLTLKSVNIHTEATMLKHHAQLLKIKNNNYLNGSEIDECIMDSLITITGVIAGNILGNNYIKALRIADELSLDSSDEYWISMALDTNNDYGTGLNYE